MQLLFMDVYGLNLAALIPFADLALLTITLFILMSVPSTDIKVLH